jgi:hypothetical protein
MVTVWRGARGDVGPLMGLLRLCVVIRTRPRTRAQGMVGLQVFHGAVSGLFRLPFLPFQAQLPCFKVRCGSEINQLLPSSNRAIFGYSLNLVAISLVVLCAFSDVKAWRQEILQLAGKKSFGSFKNHWIDKVNSCSLILFISFFLYIISFTFSFRSTHCIMQLPFSNCINFTCTNNL